MAKKSAKFFGVLLVILGILGIFWDPILGIFEVDAVHNMVHILLGAILLMFEKTNSKKGLKKVAILALIVAILGFIAKDGMILGLIETNNASDWLHLVVAAILFAVSRNNKVQNTMNSTGM